MDVKQIGWWPAARLRLRVAPDNPACRRIRVYQAHVTAPTDWSMRAPTVLSELAPCKCCVLLPWTNTVARAVLLLWL